MRLSDARPGGNRFEELSIGVETGPEPLPGAGLREVEDGDEEHRQHDQDQHRRHGRRDEEVVEGRVEDGGKGESRQEDPRARTSVSLDELLGDDGHHRADAAVHQGGTEAAHHPEGDAVLLEGHEIVDVLDRREAGADRKTDDRRVDEKGDPVARDEVDDDRALEDLFDQPGRRSGRAPCRRGRGTAPS